MYKNIYSLVKSLNFLSIKRQLRECGLLNFKSKNALFRLGMNHQPLYALLTTNIKDCIQSILYNMDKYDGYTHIRVLRGLELEIKRYPFQIWRVTISNPYIDSERTSFIIKGKNQLIGLLVCVAFSSACGCYFDYQGSELCDGIMDLLKNKKYTIKVC